MARCRPATSHYLNRCWLWCLSPYGVITPQWVDQNPLSAAYMRQWTGSALVQVMASRLFGAKPLPDTNADLLSIGLPGTNFSEIRVRILSFSFKKMHWKLLSAKMAAILFREDELTYKHISVWRPWYVNTGPHNHGCCWRRGTRKAPCHQQHQCGFDDDYTIAFINSFWVTFS